MSQEQIQKKKGFTIIEVVLVLAIAGLIFLMVFIALPALQRSQRDTQREQDLSRFMSQINSYQSNNRGGVPDANSGAMTGANGFVTRYLEVGDEEFVDPSGAPYSFEYGPGDAPSDAGKIRYAKGAKCGENGAIESDSSSTRRVAASVALEGGGALCQQN